ncbi:MAG: acyltransferase [Deltaproteobacteria bacterium]|nr:acyltransferase [Deltaproteobacteria bacterium]
MSDAIARLRGGLFRLRATLSGGRISIGPGLRLYGRLRVRGPGSVRIGRDCFVAGVPGDPSQHVVLDTHGPDASIRIGDGARLYAARISSRWEIEVGDDVLVEESGIFDTAFHSIARDRGEPTDESRERCRIAIGSRVSIGARSLVGRGVTIGEGTVVCPGSVVTRSLPAKCTALGNPARVSEAS